MWSWGDNSYGQLGEGTLKYSETPKQIHNLNNVTDIFADDGKSYAVNSDGSVYAWGAYLSLIKKSSKVPILFKGLSNIKYVISDHAIDKNGNVWSWGLNLKGEVGDGTFINKSSPGEISTLSNICWISTSPYTCFALDDSGNVWKWGWNDKETVDIPIDVSITKPYELESLSSSEDNSIEESSKEGNFSGINWSNNLVNRTNNLQVSPKVKDLFVAVG